MTVVCGPCQQRYDVDDARERALHSMCVAAKPAPREGLLSEPQFGEIPGAHSYRKPRAPWRWHKIAAAVRERPGEEAIVASYTHGTKADTMRARHRDISQLRRGLRLYYPLERWAILERTVPETWNHRLLILRYDGTFASEAELAAHRKERAAQRKAALEIAAAKRARRQMETQARAVVTAEEERIRLRQERLR